ncbi:MAG: hypothetical protein AVDCRST_MAG62-1961, partial [uncultured Sphingomonas sp.]
DRVPQDRVADRRYAQRRLGWTG